MSGSEAYDAFNIMKEVNTTMYYLCVITSCDNIKSGLLYNIEVDSEKVNIELLNGSHVSGSEYPKYITLRKIQIDDKASIGDWYEDNENTSVLLIRTAAEFVLIYRDIESDRSAKKIIVFKIVTHN